ncbi:lymphocyte antigen 6 complex locus protein G6f isoform X2 [Manis pentadactyla]|uniref:lymphocyte antigen 6 complex locus protein G6f isoform X2 n=1 Tax=Manis pentadactyla TaxID=143292 RepID=UPI00255CDABC|nr:lymphocyte antigen 6 complex locus protein G6f isoform X2 [Manis pentadactyla]
MATLFLLLLVLCGCPQAAADNIQTIYVAFGETAELPCPSPPTLHGDEVLSWFHSSTAGFSTALVAQVQMGRLVPDPGKPRRESRLRVLANYSLWLEGSKEVDAGRYWCVVLVQHHKYRNWRVYDVSVLRASKDASPAQCAPSMGWDVSWILVLLLIAGLGVTILVLSIKLWRQRVQGAQCRDASILQFKPEIQVYENIHLARLSLPARKIR